MASPTAVQQWGADYQLHQVGTGPFMFKEYVPQDHLTLVRNPDYNWAPDVYSHDGPAYLDEIEFRFFVDPAVRALALESGDADVMGEMPPQDVARLESNPEFTLHEVPVPGQPLQFFLNTAKSPTDDLRVRQALLYATDRKTIVQTIFMGYSPQAYGPLSAVTMGYDSAVEEMYAYDPVQAETLLTRPAGPTRTATASATRTANRWPCKPISNRGAISQRWPRCCRPSSRRWVSICRCRSSPTLLPWKRPSNRRAPPGGHGLFRERPQHPQLDLPVRQRRRWV